MLAPVQHHDAWRLPGCGPTCTVKFVFLPGLSGREPLEIHDPDAHERHGQRLAEIGGHARAWGVETGLLAINIAQCEVRVHGAIVHLTPTEFRLLVVLAKQLGQVVDPRTLSAEAWGPGYWGAVQADLHAVRVNIARLRGRLGDAGGAIQTVRAFGYRLLVLPLGTPSPHREDRLSPGTKLPPGQWSWRWSACRGCGTTDHRYYSTGFCADLACRRALRAEQRQRRPS